MAITDQRPHVRRRTAHPRSLASTLLGLLVGVGVLGLLVGCGSATTATSTTSPAAGTTSGTTAGYQLVPDAQVTAGLAQVRAMAAAIKATLATNQTQATADVRKMYDTWFGFEGSVRKNDKNLYLQMEDGLAAIKAGAEQHRADKVDKGVADLEAGAAAYLVRFP